MTKRLTPTEKVMRRIMREIDKAEAEFRPRRVVLRPDGTEVEVEREES